MIDLERFAQERQEIFPLIDGWGEILNRKIYLPRVENGWYQIKIGNEATIIRKATLLEIDKRLAEGKFYRGYALGNEIIPVNFDNFSRKGLGETVEVYFMNLQPFEVAKVVQWEDKRWYFYEPDSTFQRALLTHLRFAFEKEQSIEGMKELTPELRYVWLLLNLQRQSYREFQELERLKLSQAERDKRIKEFQDTFAFRLKKALSDTGSTLIKFYKYRNGWMIHWKTAINNQLVKTYINDQMRVISGGFCLSNADRQHTLQSLSILSAMFERENPLFITRE